MIAARDVTPIFCKFRQTHQNQDNISKKIHDNLTDRDPNSGSFYYSTTATNYTIDDSTIGEPKRFETSEYISMQTQNDFIAIDFQWTPVIYQLQHYLGYIRSELELLETLQNERIFKPSIVDDQTYFLEKEIENKTYTIYKCLNQCQKLLPVLKNGYESVKHKPKCAVAIVLDNSFKGFASQIQSISIIFTNRQKEYVQKLGSVLSQNMEHFRIYIPNIESDTAMSQPVEQVMDQTSSYFHNSTSIPLYDSNLTSEVNNNELVYQTESRNYRRNTTELLNIVKSIENLNYTMRELAKIIEGQGEIVDNIEANIEKSTVNTSNALTQLKSIQQMYSESPNKRIIAILTCVAITMLLILIGVKL